MEIQLLRPIFFALLVCVSICHAGQIDSDLLNSIQSEGASDILIDFEGGNSRAIQNVESRSYRSRAGKVKALTQGLHDVADDSQGPLSNYLSTQSAEHTTFWSSNQMVVQNADLPLVQKIASFKGVSNVQMLPTVKLTPIPASASPNAVGTVQWGVAKIQADKVWSEFGTTGEGVVVANIDTGVRGTHEALAGNYRSKHGWFDPYNNTTTPNDQNGHGTHTMGTIAGAGGIGVAPGAKWIACRGCNTDSCGSAQLLACGEWMLAPGGDETLIPDIVSNSWGSSIGGNTWYNKTIDAWKAAGILSAFANGNSGPWCSSSGSPGDQPTTFAVGSTDIKDRLSSFSSKGPAGTLFFNKYFKPDISAPGSDIYSAWHTGDSKYNTISGTSMATPHVAGAMALMLSAYRNQRADPSAKLSFTQVTKTIEKSADTKGLSLSLFNFPCDLTFSRTFPNNQFGHGRLNALKAVNATLNSATTPTTTSTSAPSQ